MILTYSHKCRDILIVLLDHGDKVINDHVLPDTVVVYLQEVDAEAQYPLVLEDSL